MVIAGIISLDQEWLVELTQAAVAADVVVVEGATEEPRRRLQRVFAACADGLYRFILARVASDGHTADDVIQQVCCEAARKRHIPPDDAECEAWLFGIARNRIRRHWRTLRRKGLRLASENETIAKELLSAMQRGPLPAELLGRQETVVQLMLAVTALPAADQEVLFAFYFDGRSQQAIAESLGASVKSVEMRLYRTRTRLRAMLGDQA
jgi:RNA polymerase sigma-70 factor (ECF subfamily)